jgi:hypothetical protein
MRFLLISSTAILGIAWGGLVPATAAPVSPRASSDTAGAAQALRVGGLGGLIIRGMSKSALIPSTLTPARRFFGSDRG